ncbi:MAG: hypothetical protein EOL97_07755 [Spirochaetia bacterium]|nr:hypothetical protein [Spirochaetia bacterium]
MKHLKIYNSQGFFTIDAQADIPIDQIEKEDLIKLLELSLTDDFDMDPYDAEQIKNPAHQIIYKNIYSKLHELSNHKTRLKDESESLYKEALEKYKG